MDTSVPELAVNGHMHGIASCDGQCAGCTTLCSCAAARHLDGAATDCNRCNPVQQCNTWRCGVYTATWNVYALDARRCLGCPTAAQQRGACMHVQRTWQQRPHAAAQGLQRRRCRSAHITHSWMRALRACMCGCTACSDTPCSTFRCMSGPAYRAEQQPPTAQRRSTPHRRGAAHSTCTCSTMRHANDAALCAFSQTQPHNSPEPACMSCSSSTTIWCVRRRARTTAASQPSGMEWYWALYAWT